MGVGGRCVGAWVGVDVGWGDKKLKKSKKCGLPVQNLIKCGLPEQNLIKKKLKVEVGFFSDKKSFSQIFQISAHLYHLNFI